MQTTTAASLDGIIQMHNVSKWYGKFQVLDDVSLSVQKGERVVICGPSGSGKSTLIRCINRLEAHQKGQILVNGIEMNDNVRNISRIRLSIKEATEQSQPAAAPEAPVAEQGE